MNFNIKEYYYHSVNQNYSVHYQNMNPFFSISPPCIEQMVKQLFILPQKIYLL